MDYTSRLVIAAFIGGWVGYGVSVLIGDPVYWVLIFMAMAIATDSAIRMMSGRKSSRGRNRAAMNGSQITSQNIIEKKPSDPPF